METIIIDILNPKAKKLLKDLADLDLIKIRKPEENKVTDYLKKVRKNVEDVPTLDEITNLVEEVRAENYNKKK